MKQLAHLAGRRLHTGRQSELAALALQLRQAFLRLDHREGLRVAAQMHQLSPWPAPTAEQRAALLERFARLVREQQRTGAEAAP